MNHCNCNRNDTSIKLKFVLGFMASSKLNNEADNISQDGHKIQKLIDLAKDKAKAVGNDLYTLCDMAEMHVKKKWSMERLDLLLVVTTLLYVATPVDAVPDMLPCGFVDDAILVQSSVLTLQTNIEKFRTWQEKNKNLFEDAKKESICPCVIL